MKRNRHPQTSEPKSPLVRAIKDHMNENDLSSLSSSFIIQTNGIPLRIHGKIKYAPEILKVKKRMKWYVIFRSIVAFLSVVLL
jgi:hypothetical protein